MEQLDDNSLLSVLERTHPNQYLSIYRTGSQRLKEFIVSNKYRLLSQWCDTDLTVYELQDYVPNLTLQQLAVVASYYYPLPESINNYPREQLFYNACKAGYSVEDCLLSATGDSMLDDPDISMVYNILSAYITGRYDVLSSTNFKDHKFTQSLLTKLHLPNHIDVALLHPHISIEEFCKLLYEFYKVNNDNPYLNVILDMMTTNEVDEISDLPYELLGNSNNEYVIKLLEDTGRSRKYSTATLSEYNLSNYVYVTSKCNLIERIPTPSNVHDLSAKIQLEHYLSEYDSKKYPSYDLASDIVCGNWLEAIHKVNTYNRTIKLVDSEGTDYIMSPPKYLDPMFTTLYGNSRRETFGNVLLDRHPTESSILVDINILEPENYIPLLQKWCFPDKDLSQVTKEKAKKYVLLSEYYHPYPLVSKHWDVSILLERRIDFSFEDIKFLLDSQPIPPLSSYNCTVILHVNGKDDWIDALGLPNLFMGELDLTSNELSMLLNHTYLTLEEKLDILSRCYGIDGDILRGLSGNKGQSSHIITGMILNAYLPKESIVPLLEKFGLNYKGKLTPEDIYLASRVYIIALRTGKPIYHDFPLQLLWQTTYIFRVSDSYTDDVFALTSEAPYNKKSTNALYIGDQRYYEWVTNEVRGSPAYIGNMGSKYGYTIRMY